jgi:multidrug resistance efflux pump
MSKKVFWMLTIFIAALALSACQSKSTPTPASGGSLPAGIITQGHVEPQFSQDVAFTAPGQVLEVLVAEGDEVTSGQVLARLSGGELRAVELARAEQELLAAQQAVDDLQANPELVKTQSAAAVAAAAKALADAQQQLDDLKTPDPLAINQLEVRIALLQQQLVTAQENLKDIEDRTNPDELKLAQAKAAVADLEKSLADTQQLLNDLQNPDKLLIAQLEASLPLLEAQLATAKTKAESLADGVDDDILAAAQARLVTAQAALASAQTNAATLELHAPTSGTVVGLNLQPGQVVSGGLPVLTIADLTQWVVKTDDLTEIEVVSVAPGQAVTIILDALPDSPINGTVSEIAQRYEDRRGDVTYTVTITLSDVPAAARWGMIGQVKFAEGY